MEGELKMKDEIVETRIGIYDVIYESDYKSNDGHKLYHVKCCECGYETDMQLRHIRRASKCTHINKNGTTKLFNSYTWGNNRICRIFRDMIQRCYNEHEKSYRWYGAKGIKNGRNYRVSLVNIFSVERSSQESRGFSHERFKYE